MLLPNILKYGTKRSNAPKDTYGLYFPHHPLPYLPAEVFLFDDGTVMAEGDLGDFTPVDIRFNSTGPRTSSSSTALASASRFGCCVSSIAPSAA